MHTLILLCFAIFVRQKCFVFQTNVILLIFPHSLCVFIPFLFFSDRRYSDSQQQLHVVVDTINNNNNNVFDISPRRKIALQKAGARWKKRQQRGFTATTPTSCTSSSSPTSSGEITSNEHQIE